MQPSKHSKTGQQKAKTQDKAKGKEKAFERKTIEIPNVADTEDSDLSEGDVEEFGDAVGFLRTLDPKAIAM